MCNSLQIVEDMDLGYAVFLCKNTAGNACYSSFILSGFFSSIVIWFFINYLLAPKKELLGVHREFELNLS